MSKIVEQDFRTFKRRKVTRASGFHKCDETSGSECKIIKSEYFDLPAGKTKFVFTQANGELIELFNSGFGILAFGAFVYTDKAKISISQTFTYSYGDCIKTYTQECPIEVEPNK